MSAQVTRVLYVVLVARTFGPELYGLFVYGQSVYLALLSVAALGIGHVLGAEIGQNRARGEILVGHALALRALGALFGAALCAILAWKVESELTVQVLLLVFAVALIGRALATWAENVCVAFEAARHIARQELFFRPAELVFAVLVMLQGGGVIGLAVVHAVTWWLQALQGIYIINRHVVQVRPRLAGPSMLLLLQHGIPLGISAILTSWLFQGPVVLLRQVAQEPDAIGQFGLAMQTLMILVALAWSLAAASLPVLSRSVARVDGKDRAFVNALGRLGWLGSAALGLIGFVFGPPVITFVFGAEYRPAGEILGWALTLSGPMLVGLMTSTVLVAHGRRLATVIYAMAGTAALTVFLPLFSADYGTGGALSACGLGMGIWAIGQVIQLRWLRIGSLRYSFLAPFGVAITALLIYFFGRETLGEGVALGLALLLLSLGSLGCLTASERASLSLRVLSRVTSRRHVDE